MNMTREQVSHSLIECLKNLKSLEDKKDQINEQTELTQELGVDSLDLVEIIMDIEKEFNISIPDEDAEKFKTVGDIADFIHKTKA